MERNQLIRIWIRQRVEQDAFDYCKDRGVCADREGESGDDGEGEAGSPRQRTSGVPKVLNPFVELSHEIPFPGPVLRDAH